MCCVKWLHSASPWTHNAGLVTDVQVGSSTIMFPIEVLRINQTPSANCLALKSQMEELKLIYSISTEIPVTYCQTRCVPLWSAWLLFYNMFMASPWGLLQPSHMIRMWLLWPVHLLIWSLSSGVKSRWLSACAPLDSVNYSTEQVAVCVNGFCVKAQFQVHLPPLCYLHTPEITAAAYEKDETVSPPRVSSTWTCGTVMFFRVFEIWSLQALIQQRAHLVRDNFHYVLGELHSLHGWWHQDMISFSFTMKNTKFPECCTVCDAVCFSAVDSQ